MMMLGILCNWILLSLGTRVFPNGDGAPFVGFSKRQASFPDIFPFPPGTHTEVKICIISYLYAAEIAERGCLIDDDELRTNYWMIVRELGCDMPRFEQFPMRIRDYVMQTRGIVEGLVGKRGELLEFASQELKNDPGICEAAVQNCKNW